MRLAQESFMPEIAFVTYDNCLSSSIGLPMEMVRAANDVSAARNHTHHDLPAVYGSKHRIQCSGGLEIVTQAHPQKLATPDLIILPAIWRNPLLVIRKNRYLTPLLQDWDKRGIKICAVGSSSFLLAEAGLLDKRAATTHWSQFDLFARRYPRVQLQKDFLITQSKNLYCVASVNAVADLMIHFIELLFEASIAKKVEANFSPEVRSSYATSLFNEDSHSRHSDEDIVRLQYWLNENFKQEISNSVMADMLGISTRSLNRRFKTTTGESPLTYLRKLKVEHAKELLKKSNLSVTDIAAQCGYNDTSYFCSCFKAVTTMQPSVYRSAVKAKLFTSPF